MFKLIDNISQAPKMFSVWLSAAAATVTSAWLAVPPELQAMVPPEWVATAAGVLSALALVGRLIDQGLTK